MQKIAQRQRLGVAIFATLRIGTKVFSQPRRFALLPNEKVATGLGLPRCDPSLHVRQPVPAALRLAGPGKVDMGRPATHRHHFLGCRQANTDQGAHFAMRWL